jgi:hypothetical protein
MKSGASTTLLFETEEKIGSEHWIIMLVWNQIKDKVVNVITDYYDINNEYPIVIFDDCIYSGRHIITTISYLQEEYNINHDRNINVNNSIISKNLTSETVVIRDTKTTVNKNLNNDFIIVVPYISDTGRVYLSQFTSLVGIKLKFINIYITTNIYIIQLKMILKYHN